VVIATRDRRHSVLATLARLAALPERPPVVVVDNASSDGTAVAVRDAGLARVVELGANAGAAARTIGARALDTPLLAFSDDDSWWAPGSLARAAELFRDHPAMGLLAGRILVGTEERLDPTCAEMRNSPLPRDPDLPGPPLLGFVACGAIVRRRAFLGVGGFIDRLGIGGEEALAALDLATAGWGLAYVDEVVAHHHPARDGQRAGRSRLELRNALWTTWLRRRPTSALRRSARLAATAMRGGQLGALGDAARELRWVVRERRAIAPDVEARARVLERAGGLR
jgi:GT2 family glycosyltransferase